MQNKKNKGHKIGFFGFLTGIIGYLTISYLSESFGFFLIYLGFILSLCGVVMVWINMLARDKSN
jgi:uncharacterized membrane protein HdeD (DUF308 family)